MINCPSNCFHRNSSFLPPKEVFDGLLVTLLKSHIDDGVKDDAAPIDNVEEDAQTWLFEAFVKLEFKKYMKLINVKVAIQTKLAMTVGI